MATGRVGALLQELYQRLWEAWGPQGWWPGETPFEVALGAILTQNTNWRNVARVIEGLKAEGSLDPLVLGEIPRRIWPNASGPPATTISRPAGSKISWIFLPGALPVPWRKWPRRNGRACGPNC